MLHHAPHNRYATEGGKTFRREGMMPWDMLFDRYIETAIITIAK